MLSAARKCGKVITCEEHSIIGGLGEAVCSLLSEKLPTPVRRIGVNDEFGHSGPAPELLKQFGSVRSTSWKWHRTSARADCLQQKETAVSGFCRIPPFYSPLS